MKLVIFAAGKSTRFGKAKQFTEIDNEHNFVLDYSLKEAFKAGFDDFLFIIKKEFLNIFLDTLYKRISAYAKVTYVLQDEYTKLYGTVPALYSVKDFVKEPFMVMNADDLYTYNVFKQGYEFLNSFDCNSKYLYANVAYYAINTMCSDKVLSRGLIEENNGYIKEIKETQIIIKNNQLYSNNLEISSNKLVSMNLFLFTPDIFSLIEEYLQDENEVILSSCINDLIIKNKILVKLFVTLDKIKGLTYPEDINTILEK